jgi:hypothetical protein
MKMQRKYKSITAFFWMAVYLFATLFSQNFHQHNTIFTISSLGNQGGTFVRHSSKILNEKDCLSCHFLADGQTLLPDISVKLTFFIVHFSKTFAFALQDIQSYKFLSFFLRGPPTFIV